MISIHALLAESDYTPRLSRVVPTPNFYPRSPCGERLISSVPSFLSSYFYPRSPCGERQQQHNCLFGVILFLSTLSLRRATSWHTAAAVGALFLSTLSLRRATPKGNVHYMGVYISIHALLAESDKLVSMLNSPHGKFLSTLSLRRATTI